MLHLDKEKCIGCGLCIKDCWFGALSMQDGKAAADYSRCFKCGHCIAVCPKNCFELDDYGAVPSIEYQAAEFEIPAAKLLNFIKFRRTVRQFLPKQIDKQTLSTILEAGRFTQTGGNQQNVAYIIVQDKLQELRKMGVEKLYALSKQLAGTTDPILKRYAGIWENMYTDYQQDPNGADKLFLKAPTVLVITSPAPLNAGLAAANIANMIDATPGLGNCFSGFFTRAAAGDPAFHEFLGVKDGYQIIATMMIGYHHTKYYRTVPRKAVEINWL